LSGLEDVLIKHIEILDGIDDTRGRPSCRHLIEIDMLEPGAHGTGIASTNNEPLVAYTNFLVHAVDKLTHIHESLSGSQPFKVDGGQTVTFERLALSEVSVFMDDKTCLMLDSQLECSIILNTGWYTCPLPTKI
jgi:hypothetical protein